jgi:hypothetical protein
MARPSGASLRQRRSWPDEPEERDSTRQRWSRGAVEADGGDGGKGGRDEEKIEDRGARIEDRGSRIDDEDERAGEDPAPGAKQRP